MKKTFIDADFELIVLENCVVLTSGGMTGGGTTSTPDDITIPDEEWD